MTDVLEQVGQVFGTYKDAGTLAALIVLVNLLVNLLKVVGKFPFFGRFVKAAWLPWIAIGLGALLATLTALASGVPVGKALLAGVFAGLSAIGVHQGWVSIAPSERAKQAAANQVKDALAGPELEVKKKVEALKAHIDEAAREPDKKARLKKLADLANGTR